MPSPLDTASFAELVALQLAFYQAWGSWIGVAGYGVAFNYALEADEIIPLGVNTRTVTYPANFSGSPFHLIGSAPDAAITLTIKHWHGGSISTVGTLSISTTGAIELATTGGISVATPPGALWAQRTSAADAGAIFLMGEIQGVVSMTA